MLMYVLRRFAVGVAIFLAVTAICFVMFNMRGAYAIASNLLGPDARPEQIEAKAAQLGLDRPLILQYVDWLGGLATGNLGRSFASNQQVTDIMAVRIPVTVSILLLTLVLVLVFGTILGVLSATRGGLMDRGLQITSVLLHMIPGFFLALVIVIVFAINLRWFPATGFVPISKSFPGWLSSITLPAISIALGGIVEIGLWIRASITDLLRLDFVRTLRARGLSDKEIMYKHVLRNAAAPALTMFGFLVIGLLGGVVIIERIFALPGLGMLALQSGKSGDIPVVLGVTSFMVVVIVLVNLSVDLLNALLNPKARLA